MDQSVQIQRVTTYAVVKRDGTPTPMTRITVLVSELHTDPIRMITVLVSEFHTNPNDNDNCLCK